MRKSIFFVLLLFCLTAFSQQTTTTVSITNSGGNTTFTPLNLPDEILVNSNAVTLANDVNITYSALPPLGTHWRVLYSTQISLNGHSVSFFGESLDQDQVGPTIGSGVYDFTVLYNGTSNFLFVTYTPSTFQDGHNAIDGSVIIDGTITKDKFDSLGSARIWVGNSSNVATSRALSGAITLDNTGVSTLDSVVTDVKIKTGAAIKRQKIAAGTASQVVINDASGYLTSEATLNPLRGGLGANVSSSTGFVTFSSGSATVGVMTNTRDLHVSFAANSQGTYYLTFPVAVTVTSIEARVETALGATDSATIQVQNDASTNMTGGNLVTGYLVLAASATTGTGYTSTLTSNNTFTAGQRMRLITAKGTAGGTANVQVTYTRVN